MRNAAPAQRKSVVALTVSTKMVEITQLARRDTLMPILLVMLALRLEQTRAKYETGSYIRFHNFPRELESQPRQ